ncbi:MAG: MFS transporter [Deltaproteobacteria bacterium]|nr:MFS transporter [Deltaproteobacteria bacterium]
MLKKNTINPAIRDVWVVARIIWLTLGFNLGLFLYTYSAFLFEKFMPLGSSKALQLTILLSIVMDIFVIVIEVPTGAIADYLGRKKIIILSFILLALTNFLRAWLPFVLAIQNIFILAVLASIIYTLSFTFYNGCCVAWMVDSIRERNIPEGHAPLLSRSWGYMFLAQIVGAIIGLLLYLNNYIFYAFSLGFMSALLCALFCVVFMKETKSISFHEGKIDLKHSYAELISIIKTGVGLVLKVPALLYLLLAYSIFKFASDLISYLAPVALQANLGTKTLNYYWFLVVFLGLLMAFLGSKLMEKINAKDGGVRKTSNARLWVYYVLVNLLIGLFVIGLGLKSLNSKLPLVLFMTTIVTCRFGYGFLSPAYNTLINAYIPPENSKQRATILSLGSMIVSILAIFLTLPSSGPDGKATTVGWILPGSLLVFMTVGIHILMRRYQRKIGEIPSAVVAPVVQEG